MESLFGQLNRMEFINSREMYGQALKLFNVEVKRAGRGFLVFVTDENGIPVRHLLKMSDFEERPRFYMSEQKQKSMRDTYPKEIEMGVGILKSMILKELIWQIQSQVAGSPLAKKKNYNKKTLLRKRKRGRHF